MGYLKKNVYESERVQKLCQGEVDLKRSQNQALAILVFTLTSWPLLEERVEENWNIYLFPLVFILIRTPTTYFGYGYQLSSHQPILSTKICAIADVFATMQTSKRVELARQNRFWERQPLVTLAKRGEINRHRSRVVLKKIVHRRKSAEAKQGVQFFVPRQRRTIQTVYTSVYKIYWGIRTVLGRENVRWNNLPRLYHSETDVRLRGI